MKLKKALEIRKANGDMMAHFVEKFKKEGKSKKRTEKKFDEKEIEIGMEIEKEHTTSKELRREIMLDHLTEDPHYYTKLKKIESGGRK